MSTGHTITYPITARLHELPPAPTWRQAYEWYVAQPFRVRARMERHPNLARHGEHSSRFFGGTVAGLPELVRELVPDVLPEYAEQQGMPKADAGLILNTWGDLYRACSDRQLRQLEHWLRHPSNQLGVSWRDFEAALNAGTLGLELGELHRLFEWGWSRSATDPQGFSGRRAGSTRRIQEQRQALFQPLEEPRELESLNLLLAGRLANDMLDEGGETRDALLEFARAHDLKPGARDDQAAALAAAMIGGMATMQGVALDAVIEQARLADTPESVNIEALRGSAPAGVTGAGFFKQLLDAPRKIFAEAGRAVGNVAREILRVDANVPFLSQFVLRPAGVMLTAKLFEQVGEAMRTGNITTFDERAFAQEAGQTMAASGQVLLVASPFLPPPFNVGAAAIGALSLAAGQGILEHLARQQAVRQLSAQEEAARDRQRQAEAEAARLEEEARQAEEEYRVLSGGAPDAPPARNLKPLIIGGAAAAGGAAIIGLGAWLATR
jgi:hypothetical protein